VLRAASLGFGNARRGHLEVHPSTGRHHGAADVFCGTSETIASVVINKPTTEAAPSERDYM
jgi:hypothetical protein